MLVPASDGQATEPGTRPGGDVDADGPTWFSVTAVNGCTIVEACGEIDLYTSPGLREVILAALGCSGQVIVDLAAVTFIDSTGLCVLAAARQRADTGDATLALAGPAGSVAKVLRLTGLDRAFTVHSSLDDALAASEPGGPR